MCTSQLYDFFWSLELLFKGESSKTFRHSALMGLKRTSLALWALLSESGFHQVMVLLSYFVYCNCMLWTKKHFQCHFIDWQNGARDQIYMETEQGLHHTAWVCVCTYSCAHCLSNNLFCSFLALLESRLKHFSIFHLFLNGFPEFPFFILLLIWI